MRRVNIATAEFQYDREDPEGFRAGLVRPGPDLGARLSGMSVYELRPGESICPYHYEYGEEEWLVVLEGRPTLRHPDGSDELAPWDAVFFPPGPDGAHALRNATDDTVRVLMFSNRAEPGATVYPDSDKIGIWTGNKADDLLVRRTAGLDYYDGEVPPER
jgi:uncharacterized cupin superfamily protein